MSEELDRFLEWLEERLDKYGDVPTAEMLQIDRDFFKKFVAGLVACLKYKDDTYTKRLQKYVLPEMSANK